MNKEILGKFILGYLVEKPDYLSLSIEQKQVVYETCQTIMTAIYNAIRYENVFPVIMCGDAEAKKVISKAMTGIAEFLPSTDKITITQIH